MWRKPNKCTVDSGGYMINETNEKIRLTSFRSFLEKGYEATNIRDICKEVEIKPSSLYFYYASKQELFISLYDEIWRKKIMFYKSIEETNVNKSFESRLKGLFKVVLDYHSTNILNEKFLLRYHLFPAEEINALINERYNYWKGEENNAFLDLVHKCSSDDVFITEASINNFLLLYKSFISHQIINMITNNIKLTSEELDYYWNRFWNSYNLNNNTM
jgi:AcrR family transcriptional regulator